MAGGEIKYFNEMDLDEDGLLTRDEYVRFAQMNEKTQKQEPPVQDPVPPKSRRVSEIILVGRPADHQPAAASCG